MRSNEKKHFVTALVLAALGVVVACGRDLQYEGMPCPCLAGWTCCADDNTCTQETCSKTAKRTSSADDDDDTSTSGSSGTTTSSIATLVEHASPQCLAADPTTVFWMNADGIVAAGSTVSKQTVRARENPPVTQVSTCTLLRSGEGLYVAPAEGNAIYWLSVVSDGTSPVLGDRSVTVASFNRPVSMAQDEAYLYVIDGASGEVRRLTKLGPAGEPADGGAGSTLLGVGGADAHSLIVDGDLLYWFDKTGLRRMPKIGGAITTIAAPLSSDGGIPVTRDLRAASGALYWISDGSLFTIPIAGGVAHALPFTAAGSSSLKAFTVSDRGLLLGHSNSVGLLGFEGGREVELFTYRDDEHKMQALLFDTSRFIWVSGDGTSIFFRPLLETDAKLP